jgi:hypothetical protein
LLPAESEAVERWAGAPPNVLRAPALRVLVASPDVKAAPREAPGAKLEASRPRDEPRVAVASSRPEPGSLDPPEEIAGAQWVAAPPGPPAARRSIAARERALLGAPGSPTPQAPSGRPAGAEEPRAPWAVSAEALPVERRTVRPGSLAPSR